MSKSFQPQPRSGGDEALAGAAQDSEYTTAKVVRVESVTGYSFVKIDQTELAVLLPSVALRSSLRPGDNVRFRIVASDFEVISTGGSAPVDKQALESGFAALCDAAQMITHVAIKQAVANLGKQMRQLQFDDPFLGSILTYAIHLAEQCVNVLYVRFCPTGNVKTPFLEKLHSLREHLPDMRVAMEALLRAYCDQQEDADSLQLEKLFGSITAFLKVVLKSSTGAPPPVPQPIVPVARTATERGVVLRIQAKPNGGGFGFIRPDGARKTDENIYFKLREANVPVKAGDNVEYIRGPSGYMEGAEIATKIVLLSSSAVAPAAAAPVEAPLEPNSPAIQALVTTVRDIRNPVAAVHLCELLLRSANGRMERGILGQNFFLKTGLRLREVFKTEEPIQYLLGLGFLGDKWFMWLPGVPAAQYSGTGANSVLPLPDRSTYTIPPLYYGTNNRVAPVPANLIAPPSVVAAPPLPLPAPQAKPVVVVAPASAPTPPVQQRPVSPTSISSTGSDKAIYDFVLQLLQARGGRCENGVVGNTYYHKYGVKIKTALAGKSLREWAETHGIIYKDNDLILPSKMRRSGGGGGDAATSNTDSPGAKKVSTSPSSSSMSSLEAAALLDNIIQQNGGAMNVTSLALEFSKRAGFRFTSEFGSMRTFLQDHNFSMRGEFPSAQIGIRTDAPQHTPPSLITPGSATTTTTATTAAAVAQPSAQPQPAQPAAQPMVSPRLTSPPVQLQPIGPPASRGFMGLPLLPSMDDDNDMALYNAHATSETMAQSLLWDQWAGDDNASTGDMRSRYSGLFE